MAEHLMSGKEFFPPVAICRRRLADFQEVTETGPARRPLRPGETRDHLLQALHRLAQFSGLRRHMSTEAASSPDAGEGFLKG